MVNIHEKAIEHLNNSKSKITTLTYEIQNEYLIIRAKHSEHSELFPLISNIVLGCGYTFAKIYRNGDEQKYLLKKNFNTNTRTSVKRKMDKSSTGGKKKSFKNKKVKKTKRRLTKKKSVKI